jgi:hypothetical protein
MFSTKVLAQIYGLPSQQPGTTIGYDDIFKGEASKPAANDFAGSLLSGLQPADGDLDGFFKEVFAGQVL